MGGRSKDEIADVESHDLGNTRAGVVQDLKKDSVAMPTPRPRVGGGDQRRYLIAGEMSDLGSVEPFEGNR
jgi:hypothetical protein